MPLMTTNSWNGATPSAVGHLWAKSNMGYARGAFKLGKLKQTFKPNALS